MSYIQARSDTNAGSRDVLAIEMRGIRESIRDMANTDPAAGRSSCFKIVTPTVDNAGNTSFVGDRGAHTVRISPTMDLQTTIDGSSALIVCLGGRCLYIRLHDAGSMIADLEAGETQNLPVDDMKNGLALCRSACPHRRTDEQGGEPAHASGKQECHPDREYRRDGGRRSGKIVTDLQNLLVNKEVAQKAFSMISQLNLFDMIA